MATDTQRRNSMYQLRISLDGIAPPIWRRVMVPASATLRRVHGFDFPASRISGIPA